MDRRRRDRLLVAVGVVLLAAPGYVGPLAAVGVDALVDPLGALGVTQPGAQPAAVGAAYLAVGAALLAADDWTLLRVGGVVAGAVLAAVLATGLAWLVSAGTVGVGAVFVGATLAVPALGLLYGAHDDEDDRLRILGVGVAAVATFVAYAQLRAIVDLTVPEPPVYLLLVGHLAFDAAFAVPLYLAGRPLLDADAAGADDASDAATDDAGGDA